MQRITFISFDIDKMQLPYYEDLAKYYLAKAVEYGYTAKDFIFHIKPLGNPNYFRVEIGESNVDIIFKSSWLEFCGNTSKILHNFSIDYTDTDSNFNPFYNPLNKRRRYGTN